MAPKGLDASVHLGGYWTPDSGSNYEVLGEVQWGRASYDFDITRVWRHRPSGRLLFASDNGCSCPSPFERQTVGETEEIKSLKDFDREFAPGDPTHYNYVDRSCAYSVDQIHSLRKLVEGALKERI